MIIVTSENIVNKRVVRTLGLVRGASVRGRHFGKNIVATLRGTVGGEIKEFTKILSEAREQALDRMIEEAESLGANAIVSLRFASSEIMRNAAEVLTYGTAVVIEDEAAPLQDTSAG